MFKVVVSSSRGELLDEIFVGKPMASIGSAQDNDVVIEGWRVAKCHAQMEMRDDGVFVHNRAKMSSLSVNGTKAETYGPLTFNDSLEIADYVLQVKISSTPPEGLKESPQEISYQKQKKHYQEWQRKLHTRVHAALQDLQITEEDEEFADKVKNVVTLTLSELEGLPQGIDHKKIAKRVYGEIVGYGPLDALLANDAVSEIMVNTHDEIFYQESGINRVFNGSFTDGEAVVDTIKRLVVKAGRHIDQQSPLVDATLQDGTRINAVIPPLAARGPSLTIRKISCEKLTGSHLVNLGSISAGMLKFLKVAIENRKNIVISGGTGTGKSTLLNSLADLIPGGERIVIIEDAAELSISQPNRVVLESRPPDAYGKGEVKIRDLVKNALRMSPDRIIVGECRGGEALDMLQAMNTGHDGSLTTVHANSPRDCVSRLEVLTLMSGVELPVSAIRSQIASSIDIIVQLTRFPCGSRKITRISEVSGLEGGTVQLGELFTYQQNGYDADGKIVGEFRATGVVPSFYDELRVRGLEMDFEVFAN
ncbi:MAG: CpaF family protein [Pseudomonadales bacterium]|nr:CpaF family protein [Pseudomonadales bacterium]